MSNAELIKRNARDLRKIYEHFKSEYEKWGNGSPQHLAALENYNQNRDRLAFPGGLQRALIQLDRGDPEVLEAALTFLEVRPYYNNSQYIFKILLRKVKRGDLSATQRERLNRVLSAITERKNLRKERAAPGQVPCEQCGHERTYHRSREGCMFCRESRKCMRNFDHLKKSPNDW